MAQPAVKVLFHSRHDGLEQELNHWLSQVSGQVAVKGISMDSNKYGHCLAIMYETEEKGRHYRGRIFFNEIHSYLEREANEELTAAQAQSGRFVAIGSNEYGHCLCVVEER